MNAHRENGLHRHLLQLLSGRLPLLPARVIQIMIGPRLCLRPRTTSPAPLPNSLPRSRRVPRVQTETARSAEAWRISRQPPRLCRASRPQGSGRHSLRPELHSLHTHAAKPNGAPSVSAPIPVEELRENDPPSLVPRQPPPKAVKTPHVVDSGEEGEFIDSTAAFAPEGGGDAEDPSMGAGQDSSVLRQMSALVVLAGLAAVAFDYEHGMAGFHWFQNWVRCIEA